MLSNIFIFFFAYIFYFFSSIGFGQLINFKSEKINFYENFFFGSIFLLILSFIFKITFIQNQILNILILILGLVIFFFKNKKEKKNCYQSFLLATILFVGLLISKTHEDFVAYHYQGIINLNNNFLIFGEANLNIVLSHISPLANNQQFLFNNFLDYKLVHIPIFLYLISSVGYFIEIALNKKNKNSEIIFCSLLAIMLITKFSRLSEYGYDFPTQVLLLVVAHKLIFSEEIAETKKALTLFCFAVVIKPTSLFFAPILLFKINLILSNVKKYLKKKFIIINLTLLLIILSNSFIRTGCLYYPINKTCFSPNVIEWSSKKDLKDYSRVIEHWAKGYGHQEKTNFKKIENLDEYLDKFNWFKYWINLHFFTKISDYLLHLIFIFLILFFISKKNYVINKKNYSLIIFSSLSFLFWLIYAPQFRFAVSIITILFYSLIIFIFNTDRKIDFKKLKILFLISFLIFNIKNVNRINFELKRNDVYQYLNFPWFNTNYNNFYSKEKIKFIDMKKIIIIKNIN